MTLRTGATFGTKPLRTHTVQASFREGWNAGRIHEVGLCTHGREAAEQRDRLIQAIRVLGGVERFAQCPVCLAERTNGEWHADDCPVIVRT